MKFSHLLIRKPNISNRYYLDASDEIDTGWTEHYRKSVLHLLKRIFHVRLGIFSIDLR